VIGKREELVQDLRALVEGGFVWGVKAEFEAEGTRYQELVELIAVARLAGVKVAVKIGGPEAIRDLNRPGFYGDPRVVFSANAFA